jgi:hypothetical protein
MWLCGFVWGNSAFPKLIQDLFGYVVQGNEMIANSNAPQVLLD